MHQLRSTHFASSISNSAFPKKFSVVPRALGKLAFLFFTWKTIHILKTLFISLYHSLPYYFCSSLMFMFQNQRASNIQLSFSSVAQSSLTLCDPMNCSTPGLPVHHQLLESTQTHVHWVSDAIQSIHPQSSPSSPALNLSQQRVFSNESALHISSPKYWSFSFNITPSKKHPRVICFRMDWLDLLAVQGTLKSLLQHQSSKASILQCSAFFIVQLTSIHDHWKHHCLD